MQVLWGELRLLDEMIYTLEMREGSLYAKQIMLDDARIITNWYKLSTTLDEFRGWFATPDLMKIGCALHPTLNPATVWRDEQGWIYRIASGISAARIPTWTEIEPIPG